jgi:predicted CXXCH cytochrome family protein
VKAEFELGSTPPGSRHPVPSGTLSCGDCHSPHRTPEADTGLLRVFFDGAFHYSPPSSLGTPIGDDFCYACHGADSKLPAPNGDLSMFEDSIHGTSPAMPAPRSDAKIICLQCHDPHGSDQPGLTLLGKDGADLCFTCHTRSDPNASGGLSPPWPDPVPGSDLVRAFSVQPNDYADAAADGDGVRIYHHPVSADDQQGGARTVTCASCHNPHTASDADTATASKISKPDRPLAPDAVWLPDWKYGRGYMNDANHMDQYCTSCHVNPAATNPISRGTYVPVDVNLVNDTSLDADGQPHDRFAAAGWASALHNGSLTCTACHDPHGSSNAYLLRENPVDPVTGDTSTVTGFSALDTPADRAALQTFCTTCHATWTPHNTGELCTTCHQHGGRL